MPSFLLDEDLPRSLSIRLRQKGFESAHIVELGLRGTSDLDVFGLAQERGAILISRDLGFANTLRYSLGIHQGIVVVRYPSEISTSVLVTHVVESLESLGESEFSGSLIILEPGRLRIRRPV